MNFSLDMDHRNGKTGDNSPYSPSEMPGVIEVLRLKLLKDELVSIQMGLCVTSSGKLFKISSDGSKLWEKIFCILYLQNVASIS